MFDRDFWQEVLQTIVKQKWRSVLTAFGVFWGLFMLMMLIGAGMGFQTGAVGQLNAIPANSAAYYTAPTTVSYKGFERGRQWMIESNDVAAIATAYPKLIDKRVFLKYVPDKDSLQTVSYGDKTDILPVAGVSPFYGVLSPQRVVAGRYLNDFDCMELRKVCIIGEQVAKTLFADAASAVGKTLHVGENSFNVVGVTRKTNAMIAMGPNESSSIFIPITTAQYLYNCLDKADCVFLVLDDHFPSTEYCPKMADILRHRHHISPDDKAALIAVDLKSQLNQFDIMSDGVNALIWLIGLGTLLAGLIGIANIMMVTVKERTQEIGVRRALGAQPIDIIKQIMCESLVLTLAAGTLGIVVGVWVMLALNKATASSLADSTYFSSPYVPFVPAVAAFIILTIGGLVAGFIPAKRALSIKAIDALREE